MNFFFFFFGKCFPSNLQIRSKLLKHMQIDFFNYHCEEKRELSAIQIFLQLYFMEKKPQTSQHNAFSTEPALLFSSLYTLAQTHWLRKKGSCPLKIVIASEE